MARTDAFYEQRLKAGKDALAARRGPEAVEELRIAAFGFLDEPRQLAEALAYLALAQNGLGRSADVEATLVRFVDAERRTAGYDRQILAEDARVQFEALLNKQFGKQLASIPSLAAIANPDATRKPAPAPAVPPVVPPSTSASSAPTQSESRPATQPTAQPSISAPASSSTPIQAAPPQGDGRPAAQQPSRTQPQSPASTQAPATQAPNRVAQNDVRPAPAQQQTQAQPALPAGDPADQARQLIATRRAAQAVTVLTPAIEHEPQRRELRLLLLQAAAMSSDWKSALNQVTLLRPFNDTEPVYMFYAAVTMWESNRPTEARELLERALPRLNRTAYVESYVKKILPERAAS